MLLDIYKGRFQQFPKVWRMWLRQIFSRRCLWTPCFISTQVYLSQFLSHSIVNLSFLLHSSCAYIYNMMSLSWGDRLKNLLNKFKSTPSKEKFWNRLLEIYHLLIFTINCSNSSFPISPSSTSFLEISSHWHWISIVKSWQPVYFDVTIGPYWNLENFQHRDLEEILKLSFMSKFFEWEKRGFKKIKAIAWYYIVFMCIGYFLYPC